MLIHRAENPTPIAHLMIEAGNQIMSEESNKQEVSYRKGYYQGYDQAINDIQVMIKRGFPPGQSIMIAQEFIVEDLNEWRKGDPAKRVTPPQLNPKR
jgi:hypothetical protein